MQNIQVLLLSRNQIFRWSMEKLITQWNGFEVKGVISQKDRFNPIENGGLGQLILTELEPESAWELMTIETIKLNYPNIPVVGISTNFKQNNLHRSIQQGVNGFITKQASEIEIKRGLLTTFNCGYYFDQELAKTLTEELLNPLRGTQITTGNRLSEKETKTLQLICKGASVTAIADTLAISPRTVEGYKSKIKEKLNAPNFINAIFKAMEFGIIRMSH